VDVFGTVAGVTIFYIVIGLRDFRIKRTSLGRI